MFNQDHPNFILTPTRLLARVQMPCRGSRVDLYVVFALALFSNAFLVRKHDTTFLK